MLKLLEAFDGQKSDPAAINVDDAIVAIVPSLRAAGIAEQSLLLCSLAPYRCEVEGPGAERAVVGGENEFCFEAVSRDGKPQQSGGLPLSVIIFSESANAQGVRIPDASIREEENGQFYVSYRIPHTAIAQTPISIDIQLFGESIASLVVLTSVRPAVVAAEEAAPKDVTVAATYRTSGAPVVETVPTMETATDAIVGAAKQFVEPVDVDPVPVVVVIADNEPRVLGPKYPADGVIP